MVCEEVDAPGSSHAGRATQSGDLGGGAFASGRSAWVKASLYVEFFLCHVIGRFCAEVGQ